MKHKKIITSLFLISVFILCLGMVSAIDISVDNYYPAPVEAGEYLNVWLKVTNRGSSDAENSVIKLKQGFPFSLDPGEDEEVVISSIKANGGFVIQKFKIRVDGGAAEGENRLTFQYADFKGSEWKEKTVPITVVESQTSFDVVLQELNEEGVFIAIANIGKNPANAVTIRVPNQEHFRTQTVSASIVGNLASGDYTLVGFQILPKTIMQRDVSGATAEERQQMRQQILSEGQTLALTEEQNLLIQIDYTDPLGSRRTIFKEIEINPSLLMTTGITSTTSTTGTSFNRMRSTATSTSILSDKWFWSTIGLLALIIGMYFYKKVKKRKD